MRVVTIKTALGYESFLWLDGGLLRLLDLRMLSSLASTEHDRICAVTRSAGGKHERDAADSETSTAVGVPLG